MKCIFRKRSFSLIKRNLIFLLLSAAQLISARNTEKLLSNMFKNQPESAKPGTWWHWTKRLAGDMKSAQGNKLLNSPLFVMASGLNESGLIGPVKIQKYANDKVTH